MESQAGFVVIQAALHLLHYETEFREKSSFEKLRYIVEGDKCTSGSPGSPCRYRFFASQAAEEKLAP